jgi:hypothetical protein
MVERPRFPDPKLLGRGERARLYRGSQSTDIGRGAPVVAIRDQAPKADRFALLLHFRTAAVFGDLPLPFPFCGLALSAQAQLLERAGKLRKHIVAPAMRAELERLLGE